MLQMATRPPDRRSVARSGPERRRGPRPHVAPTLEAMRRSEGRPLRLRDLVALTGWSKAKLLADIRGGYLGANRVRCGTAHVWLVPFCEAQRYLRALGLLREIP